MAITTTEAAQIKKLVAAMFNLAPSAAIYNDMVTSFEAGGNSLSLLATNLSASGVYQNQLSGLDTAGLANKLMTSLGLTVGTTAGDAAYDYFTARLGAGVTLDQVAVEAVTYLADDTRRNAAFDTTVTLLNNKVTVIDALIASNIVAATTADLDYVDTVTADTATVTTATAATATAANDAATLANKVTFAEHVYASTATLTAAELSTDSITDDTATLDAATAAVDALEPQTFSLTTGTTPDAITGTVGNDTITGTNESYGSSDVIVDTSSTDNDTLNLTTTADITATATVVNVENVNVAFSGFTSAGGVVGATTLEIAADNISSTKFGITASGATAVTALKMTALATGSEITAGSTFAAVTLVADDNSALTVKTGAASATATSTVTATATTGALTNLTVSETVGKVSVAATDMDGTLTVTSAKDATINAAAATAATVVAGGDVTITSLAAATSVSITTTGADSDVSGATNTLDAATTLTVTSAGQVDIDFDAALSATISAVGQNLTATGGADKTSTLTGDVATTLNLSGNGGAVDFDITGINTAKTLNISGSQNVKVLADIADIDGLATGLTLANTNTGTTTLSISGTQDGTGASLKDVATSTKIVFTSDMTDSNTATRIITLASGADVTFDAAQGAGNVARFTGVAATASTNAVTFTMDKSTSSTTTYAIGSLTTTNIKTVNFDLSKDTASTTLGTVNVGAANNVAFTLGANNLTSVTDITAAKVTFTGSGDLTLADLTVDEMNASAVTGDVSYTVQTGDVALTGDGDDTLALGSAIDAYIVTGAGSDTVSVTGDNTAKTLSIDFGTGTTDTLNVAASSNLNASTVSITNIDKIVFAGDATMRDTQLNASTAAIYGATDSDITIAVTQAANDFSALAIDTATISTADGDSFIINASTYTAAVAITGTDADDVITGATNSGASVFTDTLDGGAGNDTLVATQGGDSYVGGTGTDTLNVAALAANNIESGASDSSGVIVNLGATAVSATTVSSAMGTSYISKSITEIGAGKVGYLFATDATTNSSVLATVATVENVTGTTGADYIVGTSGANIINGGAGADYIVAGDGADTISFGDTLVAGDTAGDAGDLAGSLAADTIAAFVTADDSFLLDETIFGNMGNGASIGATATAISTAQFASVADGSVSLSGGAVSEAGGALDVAANGAIVYVQDDKKLYFIEAGATLGALDTMTATEYVHIATIGTLTGTLAAADILAIA